MAFRCQRSWRDSVRSTSMDPLRPGSPTPRGSWLPCRTVGKNRSPREATESGEPCAFEQLLAPVVAQAQAQLRAGIGQRALGHFRADAWDRLGRTLLQELSGLCAPALYERFSQARNAAGAASELRQDATAIYRHFVADMQAGGFARLFEDKPVLLRLIATVTRQWIDTSREFMLRLDADLPCAPPRSPAIPPHQVRSYRSTATCPIRTISAVPFRS